MKYVYKIEDGKMEEWLFDLSRDMGEKNDLKASEAKELKRLRRLLAKWERNVKPVR